MEETRVIANVPEINKNLFSLRDKVAVITGAGRGMGQAIALGLATFGANIVATDIDLESASKTAEQVEAVGRRSIALRHDVRRAEDAAAVIENTVRVFGRIDILVNNAGILSRSDFLSNTLEQWNKLMDINLNGVYNCAKAVAGQMIRQKSGCMINIGSSFSSRAAAFNMGGGSPDYCTSKAAIQALTRSIAQNLAPYGIRANAVAPGIVDSPMHTDHRNAILHYAQKTPMGRLQDVSDVVGTIIFLSSDAAVYITGQTIHVNGGMLMVD